MGVGGASGMVCSILSAFHCGCFESLSCIRKIFHRIFRRIRKVRKPKRACCLTRASGPYLTWIVAEFVELRFKVAFAFGCALIIGVFALISHKHSILSESLH